MTQACKGLWVWVLRLSVASLGGRVEEGRGSLLLVFITHPHERTVPKLRSREAFFGR